MLAVGSTAPDFRLIGTTGNAVTLRELRGRKVVLYFYPRDDTPGCTREACEFRDNLARLGAAGVEVFGVSKDSLASHERFRSKYRLPFELLSDPDNSVATAFGAWGEKSLYGRRVLGTIRSTYLIDEKGRVRAIWSPVKVDGHVEQVLAALAGPARAAKRASKKGPRKAGAKAGARPAAKKRLMKKRKASRRAARGR